MSMLDKIKGMLKGHPDQARQGVDKTGDFVDDKTGNKHQRQVDTGQDKLKDEFGRDRPPS